jgi:hypothetical protein
VEYPESNNEKPDAHLPEGEEDDRLDGEELEYRVVGAQQVLGGKVEDDQSVKGQGDAHVVDDGHVQVSLVHTRQRAVEKQNHDVVLQNKKHLIKESWIITTVTVTRDLISGVCILIKNATPPPKKIKDFLPSCSTMIIAPCAINSP